MLEPPGGKSRYAHQGYRVVEGLHLMQAASDIFLGWASTAGGHDYYVRQFRDMKVSAEVETFKPSTLVGYATMCGWALARAHAKAGDAAMIDGYLGSGNQFDDALAQYSEAYADQAERDYESFQSAIRSGRLADGTSNRSGSGVPAIATRDSQHAESGAESKMRHHSMLAVLAAVIVLLTEVLTAQDLSPRAYVITPLHSNAVTLTWSFYDGSIDYNGALPVSGATGTYSVPIFSYYHGFGLFGHSANVVASLPYGVGNFQGTTLGAEKHLYRSGLLDSAYRFSVNLKGGPAMPQDEFVKWKQKLLLGVSLKVAAPTGQYDPTKLINWDANRWGFKPEFGYSQRWGNWIRRRILRGLVLHHESRLLVA